MSKFFKKEKKRGLSMIGILISNLLAAIFSIWAAVEFILYLVKDDPFNFTSLWLLGIAIVFFLVLTFKTFFKDSI